MAIDKSKVYLVAFVALIRNGMAGLICYTVITNGLNGWYFIGGLLFIWPFSLEEKDEKKER